MNFRQFCSDLSGFRPEEIVFIGLGNHRRGDDAAGLFFTEELRQQKYFENANFILAGTNPENYLQAILDCKARLALFIDIAHEYDPPGALGWLPGDRIESAGISTHAFSISVIEKYIRAQKGPDVRYFVIKPDNCELDKPLSEFVKKNIKDFFRSDQ